MIKYYCLFLIIAMFSTAGFSQDAAISDKDELRFTLVKNLGPDKTVYFHMEGIKDQAHQDAILARLLKDPSISDGRIFKTAEQVDRCQLYMDHSIDAAYVRSILLEKNVDYKFTSVSINGHLENKQPERKQKSGQSPPVPVLIEGFPKYKDTGNPETDRQDYAERKRGWIENNPDKYQEYLDSIR